MSANIVCPQDDEEFSKRSFRREVKETMDRQAEVGQKTNYKAIFGITPLYWLV